MTDKQLTKIRKAKCEVFSCISYIIQDIDTLTDYMGIIKDDSLYDLVYELNYLSYKKRDGLSYYNLIEKYNDSISDWELITLIKDVIQNGSSIPTWDVRRIYLYLALILECRNTGMIRAIDYINKKVLWEDSTSDFSSMSLLIIIMENFWDKITLCKNLNYKIIKQARNCLLTDKFINIKYEINTKIIKAFMLGYPLAILGSIYKTLDIPINNCGISILDVYSDEDKEYLISNGVLNILASKHNILKHRRMFVREKGVTINFKEQFDSIDWINLYEYHDVDKGIHIIPVTYKYKDSDYIRTFPLFIDDIGKSMRLMIFSLDLGAFLLATVWLGLGNDMLSSLNEYPDIKHQIESSFNKVSKCVEEDNVTYTIPVHWNYTNDSKHSITSKTNNENNFILSKVSIGTYTRKLPFGQKASDEAKALANRYYIELKEGYTLVDEFERSIKKKII